MTEKRKSTPTGRGKHVAVRTAKGRKIGSTLWLKRQLNDPYVAEAKKRGYRSRSAFKLAQIDDQLRVLRPGARVVDLGAAPGGWSQVAVERVRPTPSSGKVVGIDLTAIPPIKGATIIQGDFLAEDAPQRLHEILDGQADVVLSDMATSATGDPQVDHIRIMALAEAAQDYAESVLAPGGAFVCKVLRGGSERGLLDRLRRNFAKVKHIKPASSRADSAEMFVIATGFRGEHK